MIAVLHVLRLALVAIGFACLLWASPVRGAGELATELKIRPVEPVTVGAVVLVHADLHLVGGGPLAGEAIEFALDGEHVRRVRTAPDGSAEFRLPRDLAPGDHSLEATYDGQTNELAPASANLVIVVTPFGLEIETVPPLPGMAFTLDGVRFEAEEDGIARIAVEVPGPHVLAVLDSEYVGEGQRAVFSRWYMEQFGPEITINVPTDRQLQAGFDVYHPASQVFIDREGGVVDPSRLSSITMRSSLGQLYEYPDGEEREYKASRAVRRPNGLESVPVRYTVESVEVDGANVVNSGQQRFFVEGDEPWEITLLLYSATIEPHDALFGFTAGDSIEVTYPNGKVELVRPNADGVFEVPWLARGIYRMTVADPPGWAPGVPVALSRDQVVELRVITYVDMVLAVLTASTVAIGLFHLGRPHFIPALIGGVRRRARMPRPVVVPPRPAGASQIEPIPDQAAWLRRRVASRAQPVAVPRVDAAEGHVLLPAAIAPAPASWPTQRPVAVEPSQPPPEGREHADALAGLAAAEWTAALPTSSAPEVPRQATDGPEPKPKAARKSAPTGGAAAATTRRTREARGLGPEAAAAGTSAKPARRSARATPRTPVVPADAAAAAPKPATARKARKPREKPQAIEVPVVVEPPMDPATARRMQLEVLGLTVPDLHPIAESNQAFVGEVPPAAIAEPAPAAPSDGPEPMIATSGGAQAADALSASTESATAAVADISGSTEAASVVPTGEGAADLQICRQCGFVLWIGARFCRRCGHPLGEHAIDEAPAPLGIAHSFIGSQRRNPSQTGTGHVSREGDENAASRDRGSTRGAA